MAQSTSSSWLREARRLSSGPGPFRNPTWAGAGPAIAPRGGLNLTAPPTPLLPDARFSCVMRWDWIIPREVPRAPAPASLWWVLAAPQATRRENGPGTISAAFWLPPSMSLGTARAGLAPSPASAAHPAAGRLWLWVRRGARDDARRKMEGPAQTSPPHCQERHFHPPLAPAPHRPAAWHACSQASVEGGSGLGWGCGECPLTRHPSSSYSKGRCPLDGCTGGWGSP